MKQEIIGTYYCGDWQIELVLREGVGGEFWFSPEKGKIPRMKIGADHREWKSMVDVFLHEVMEFVMVTMRLRYEHDRCRAQDNSAYTFIMTHEEFAEAVALAADYMVRSVDDLKKAWEKWHKPKSKAKRKRGKKT